MRTATLKQPVLLLFNFLASNSAVSLFSATLCFAVKAVLQKKGLGHATHDAEGRVQTFCKSYAF